MKIPVPHPPSSCKKDLKDTFGKLRYDLVPPEWIEAMAEVMSYGAQKYDDNNWRSGVASNYEAALMRHFQAWRMGEDIDPESHLPHLAHALANIGILITLTAKEGKNGG